MNNCINQSHPDFKALLTASNMNPHILAAKIAVWQTQNKTEEFPQLQDILRPTEINATLKVINALVDFPRKFYPSNSIQGFYNDLIKKGVPANQIQIVKDYIDRNNIKEISTQDLMVGIMSEMSYTIEINTAKEILTDPYQSYDEFGEYIKDVKKEYGNSQYYSGMTVPGGTNYTENEIATPQIIPSIKGHSAFSTEHGIGWHRSDTRQIDFEKMLESKQIKEIPC